MSIKAIAKMITDPAFRFSILASRGFYDKVPDEEFLRRKFKLVMGYDLDLENPKTFNEKLQWLKLYDRRPEYTTMVDKYAAKQYVADRIGEEHIIPTLGVWDKFDDIDFNKLPDQFVLKCTHDSGGLVICKDKSKLDMEAVRKKIIKSLKCNYYLAGREWPYKNVPRRILAEQYMEDEQTKELRDYKFFCFNGESKAMFIATGRQKRGEDVKFDFFDTDFNHLPFKQGHENASVMPAKPERFQEMIEFAEKISKGIPHVRCDFYEVNGEAYFGEMTFYHFSGFTPFEPAEWDKRFDDMVDIKQGRVLLHKKNMHFHITYAEEPLLESPRGEGLTDYKFYCFNGEPKFLYVAFANMVDGRKNDLLTYLNLDWSKAPFYRTDHGQLEQLPEKPAQFDDMLEIAKKLSQGIPFLRVDLYYISGQIYFSELTFSPGSGFGKFSPLEWDRKLGDWITLPEKR